MTPTNPRERARWRCLIARHAWTRHPNFAVTPVRLCTQCGRVEHQTFSGYWRRMEHLEARDA